MEHASRRESVETNSLLPLAPGAFFEMIAVPVEPVAPAARKRLLCLTQRLMPFLSGRAQLGRVLSIEEAAPHHELYPFGQKIERQGIGWGTNRSIECVWPVSRPDVVLWKR